MRGEAGAVRARRKIASSTCSARGARRTRPCRCSMGPPGTTIRAAQVAQPVAASDGSPVPAGSPANGSLADRVAALETEFAALRAAVDELLDR